MPVEPTAWAKCFVDMKTGPQNTPNLATTEKTRHHDTPAFAVQHQQTTRRTTPSHTPDATPQIVLPTRHHQDRCQTHPTPPGKTLPHDSVSESTPHDAEFQTKNSVPFRAFLPTYPASHQRH